MATKKKKPASKAKKPSAKNRKPAAKAKKAEKKLERIWLEAMLADDYFPKHLVKKGQKLLADLAKRIDRERPEGEAVYVLTHATTEAFNDLQEEFFDAESEIETAAREAIAADVGFILEFYGYEVDLEEAISPRDW